MGLFKRKKKQIEKEHQRLPEHLFSETYKGHKIIINPRNIYDESGVVCQIINEEFNLAFVIERNCSERVDNYKTVYFGIFTSHEKTYSDKRYNFMESGHELLLEARLIVDAFWLLSEKVRDKTADNILSNLSKIYSDIIVPRKIKDEVE